MKEIIIDGVDVSGCTYYSHNGYKNVSCMNAHNGMMKCESFPCYYKQLQKAKAEIADLKFYIDSYSQVWEVGKLRVENEKLKKEIDNLSRLS
jgi:hypothetical protein